MSCLQLTNRWLIALLIIFIDQFTQSLSLPPYDGKLCAFADLNYDTFTDVLAVNGSALLIGYLASSDTLKNEANFKSADRYTINIGKDKFIKGCATGDFNNDEFVDVLISYRPDEDAEMPTNAEIWYGSNKAQKVFSLSSNTYKDLVNFPSVVDLNADGTADLVLQRADGFSCTLGPTDPGSKDTKMSAERACFQHGNGSKPSTLFTHTFVDLLNTGAAAKKLTPGTSLAAEFLIGIDKTNENDVTVHPIQVWQQTDSNPKSTNFGWNLITTIGDPSSEIMKRAQNELMPTNKVTKDDTWGLISVGDFNADGTTDIIMPLIKAGEQGAMILYIWHRDPDNTDAGKWSQRQTSLVDGGSVTWSMVMNDYKTFQLRVGDANSDGYPDLLLLLEKSGSKDVFVAYNEAQDCSGSDACKDGWNRQFTIAFTGFVSLAGPGIGNVAFFDLFEDGILDYVTESEKSKKYSFQFHPTENIQDATFLKVEVYTPTCDYRCKDRPDGQGSVISYPGATIKYSVETDGGTMYGLSTQRSQTGYNALQLPFILFGMGRNPNFVEKLEVGVPSPTDQLKTAYREQVVPNSRMYIVPPKDYDGHWIMRLYVTPSRLVLLSFATLCALCGIVLLIIVFLWWQERREDQKEREAESHKFNFTM